MHKAKIFLFLFFALPLLGGDFRVIDGKEFPKMGMFAAANQILGQLFIYETKQPVEIDGLLVDFGDGGLYYDPALGPNWWTYYFEPLCLGSQENSTIKHPPKEEYFQAFKKRRRMTRTQASEIVKKYIRVRLPLLEKVEAFASLYFVDFFVIGVHYRGTDKSLEAPRVPYEDVFQAIAKQIPKNQSWKIFAATDEFPFLEALQEAFPGQVIACDAYRSKNERGIHLSSETPYQIGEEALIDALLLSKCNLLIRTSSNLSLWSTYFNPALPFILLNKNYRSQENAEPE